MYLKISKLKQGLLNGQLCLQMAAVLCVVAKSYYYLCHISLSVHPHGTDRFSLVGFSLNLISEYFKIILKKIQAALNCDKNNALFTVHIYHNALLNSSQNKNWFRQKFWRKSKHISYVQ